MVIKIGPTDELASIIDKIVTQEDETVYLDIGENAHIAQKVLNFKLLKSEIESVGKDVVLLTNDERIKMLAQKADIRAIPKSNNSQEDEYGRPVEADEDGQRVHVTDIVAPQVLHREVNEDFVKPQSESKETDRDHVDLSQASHFAPASISAREGEAKPKKHKQKREKKQKQKKNREYAKGVVVVFKKTAQAGSSLSSLAMRQKRTTAIIVAGSLVLGSIGFLAFGVLPSAAITLYPKSLQDNMSVDLVADSNVSSGSPQSGVIPSQILEERRENIFTIPATGSAQVENRAEGTIEVFNEYSSQPQTLVANTRFVSSDGKLFRTTETIVVPGAQVTGGNIIPSSISVGAIADAAGEDYNIGPTSFSIPGFQGTDRFQAFYGRSSDPMEGGFSGTRTVVTQQDIDDAQQKLEEEFLVETEQLLRDKAPESLVLIEDSVETSFDTLDIDAVANDPKDEFTIRAVAVSRAFLVDQSNVDEVILNNFTSSSEYNSDYELSDNREISYLVKELNFEDGYSEITAQVQQVFVMRLNVESIYDEVKGKDEIEVRRILSQKENLEKSQVRFWPIWVKTVPSDTEKIEINVELEAN